MPNEKRNRRIDRVLSQIQFHEEVPEDVVTRFEDVKPVLELARQNQRMLRVAIEYTMTTVELAFRLLCKQCGFEEVMDRDSDQTLSNLLEWLYKRDYLPHRVAEEPNDRPRSSGRTNDRDLPSMYQALRDLRNSWIHTRDASWLGWGFLKTIPRQADFINRLYKAPRKRREGRKKRRVINLHCQRLKKQGAVLQLQSERHPLYELNMLYCEVGDARDAYYFAMWPLFNWDQKRLEGSEFSPFVAKCTSVCLTGSGSLKLQTRRGTSLLLDRETSNKEQQQIQDWFSDRRSRGWSALQMFGPATLRAYLLDLHLHHLVLANDLKWID